ncbi:cell surface protein, partial [Enterococcus mundtii]|nr:cell surface protein [Enterococcus mundtii]
MRQVNTYRKNKIQQAGLVLFMVFVSLLAPMRVGAEEGTLNFYV